jgi:hypothetical protein
MGVRVKLKTLISAKVFIFAARITQKANEGEFQAFSPRELIG